MHQQTYCHTLLQPFFKIFLFRIYAPTIHSTDIEFDETSVPVPHIPRPHCHANQSTNDPQSPSHTTTHHRYHTPQIPQPYSLHKHIQPPHTNTRPLDASPPTDVDVDVDADRTDVDAAPMQSQPRCTRSHAPVRNWTGQADRIRPYKTRPDRIRPPIHN